MSLSSHSWIPSLQSTRSIAAVRPAELRSSGCATSFLSFYHHLPLPWCPSTHLAALSWAYKGMFLFFLILTIVLDKISASGSHNSCRIWIATPPLPRAPPPTRQQHANTHTKDVRLTKTPTYDNNTEWSIHYQITGPHPHSYQPSYPPIDIGANCSRTQVDDTSMTLYELRDTILVLICKREGGKYPEGHYKWRQWIGQQQRWLGMMWRPQTWMRALVGCRARLWEREGEQGCCRRVGGWEQESRTNIGMPSDHDDDDKHAPWEISEWLDGASIAPKSLDIGPPQPPSLPTPSPTNIGLSHPTQATYWPQSHASPIIWVGGHNYVVYFCLRGSRRCLPTPHPDACLFWWIPTTTLDPVQR